MSAPRFRLFSRLAWGLAGTGADLRRALRRLRRDRAFAAAALVTLALCIGANTAVFSLVYGLVFRPLPFPAPDRIVQITNLFRKTGPGDFQCNVVQYADFKAHCGSFAAIGLLQSDGVMVGEPGDARPVGCATATADIFDVLGLRPVLGRFFSDHESRPGEDKVVVLAESTWRSQYHADPGVLGQAMRVEGATCQIIGVAPRAFEALNAQARFIRPLAYTPEEAIRGLRYACTTPLLARLRPGVTPARAADDVGSVERHFYDSSAPAYREALDRFGHSMAVGLLQDKRTASLRSPLYLLQAGAVFVLLIGCLNVANLMLARANAQQGELALRTALGAGRGAIARLLLVESFTLTLAGAGLGVALATGGLNAINHFASRLLEAMEPVTIDRAAAAYTTVLSAAVALSIGLIPFLHVRRTNLTDVLQRSSRGASGAHGVRAWSGLLVTGQIAIALLLLSGAGLLVHSFVNAVSVRPGFDPSHLAVARIPLPAAYQTEAKAASFQRALEQGLREIPGVEAAALATGIPYQGALGFGFLDVKDGTARADSVKSGAFQIGASLDYFRTLRLPLLSGRLFDAADSGPDRRQVFVVDESFAKKYFPGRSALGGQISFSGPPAKGRAWPAIVGVVRDVPHNGVEDRSGTPFVYYPLLPSVESGLCLLVRSDRPAADLFAAIRQQLHAVDPSLPLLATGTAQQAISETHDERRALMLLVIVFAALALFLSAVGIYGVLAYDVSQRTREIGIRGAIGASRKQIIGLVMRQGLWKIGIGLALGLAGALVLARFMASLLFDLKPTDPWAYAVVGLLLGGVALAASYLPARRAARIDPLEALRTE